MNEFQAVSYSLAVVSFWVAFWIKGPELYHWYMKRKIKRRIEIES